MRVIAALDWGQFFERASVVERTSAGGPRGRLRRDRRASRDRYRHAVEDIAARSRSRRARRRREAAIARRGREAAGPAARALPRRLLPPRRGPARARARRGLPGPGGRAGASGARCLARRRAYLGAIGLASTARGRWPARWSRAIGCARHRRSCSSARAAARGSLAASGDHAASTGCSRRAAAPSRSRSSRSRTGSRRSSARSWPFRRCSSAARTTCAISLERPRGTFARQPGPETSISRCSPTSRTPTERAPGEAELLEQAQRGIAAAQRAACGQARTASSCFHRRRLWNAGRGCWMGWERKRGKLEEFNRLLRGEGDTSFAV